MRNVFLAILILNTIFSWGQSLPSSDSLEVLNRTAGLEEYYQDPLKWKSQLPNTSEYLDSLHSAYPENRFLGLQYANVLDHLSYYVMLRRDLENALEILNKSLAFFPLMPRWRPNISTIWLSTVKEGFRLVIGS